MSVSILDSKIQQFIDESIGIPISELALKKNPFPDVEWIKIINQIEAKSRAKNKLPTWFRAKNIIYPSKISIEQTSSEITAAYKSTIVSGETLIDLTGGFGVDDFYFSKKIKKVAYCEINSELAKIAEHNFAQLNVSTIECFAQDSFTVLNSFDQKWDWIYIDPSRRNEVKGKVFRLCDCEPNVVDAIDLYFKKSDAVLIKTAPLLDISIGLSELKNVKTVHIVALENEVKELLWEMHKDYTGTVQIKTVNYIRGKQDIFEFVLNQDNTEPNYSLPQKYIYEPNSAIMKSGGFSQVGLYYNLAKLHKHSHLYTSDKLIDFPGRIFEIQECFQYAKKELKNKFKNAKYNITTRNFPESVEQIRSRWNIKDGGDLYCFFTTDTNEDKIVMICKKI